MNAKIKKWKKGDVVSFKHENEDHCGIVIKGGSKIVHVHSELFDWNSYLKANASIFEPSTSSTPKLKETQFDTHIELKLSISKIAGRQGYPFDIMVKRDGVHIFSIYNRADGSMSDLYFEKDQKSTFNPVFQFACDWVATHSNTSSKNLNALYELGEESQLELLTEIAEWKSKFGGIGINPKKFAKHLLTVFLD